MLPHGTRPAANPRDTTPTNRQPAARTVSPTPIRPNRSDRADRSSATTGSRRSSSGCASPPARDGALAPTGTFASAATGAATSTRRPLDHSRRWAMQASPKTTVAAATMLLDNVAHCSRSMPLALSLQFAGELVDVGAEVGTGHAVQPGHLDESTTVALPGAHPGPSRPDEQRGQQSGDPEYGGAERQRLARRVPDLEPGELAYAVEGDRPQTARDLGSLTRLEQQPHRSAVAVADLGEAALLEREDRLRK